MPQIIQAPDASAFLHTCATVLEQRESENNLPLGLAHTLKRDPSFYGPEKAFFFLVLQKNSALGGALMTPPRRLILSRIDGDLPVVMDRLADLLSQKRISVPGTTGPQAEVEAFTIAWTTRHPSLKATVEMSLRVFEARSVIRIQPPPGNLRRATPADQELMAAWFAASDAEIGETSTPQTAATNAAGAIKDGTLYLWQDTAPVSMAKAARPMRHGISINAVYTPPQYRSRGYATACVSALTQKLLTEGHDFCSLYTDLANPISNSIYAKIGYRPLGDALTFDFSSPASGL